MTRARQLAAHVRSARALGIARRRRRMPAALPPTMVVRAYATAILELYGRVRAAFAPLLAEAPALIASAAADRARHHDADEARRMRQLVDDATARVRATLNPRTLEDLAQRMGRRASDHQRLQLEKQARAAIGIDPFIRDAGLRSQLDVFSAENVALIKGLGEDAASQIEKAVTRAMASGSSADALAAEVDGIFGVGEKRSRLIARDQIGKLNGQVAAQRNRELGLTHFVWRTVHDDRVRGDPNGKYPKAEPSHYDRDGKTYAYADPPKGEDGEPELPGTPINCFPGDTPARLLHARVKKAYRRWYSGQLTELVTDTGEVVRCTPNHPVLTGAGWQAAHLIEVGQHVFQASLQGLDGLVDDPESVDTSIEEIFRACSSAFVPHGVGGGATWFHGDGSDEQVDVVDVDRGLREIPDLPLSQRFCQELLAGSDDPGLRCSPAYLGILGHSSTPERIVRGAGKLLALVGRHLTQPERHGVGATARLDAIAHQLRPNVGAGDVEVLRDLLHAPSVGVQSSHHLARVVLGIWRRAMVPASGLHAPSAEQLAQAVAVAADRPGRLGEREPLIHQPRRVVEKRLSEPYVGNVYNLETSSGWYATGNRTIVSNCRCYSEPDFSSVLGED